MWITCIWRAINCSFDERIPWKCFQLVESKRHLNMCQKATWINSPINANTYRSGNDSTDFYMFFFLLFVCFTFFSYFISLLFIFVANYVRTLSNFHTKNFIVWGISSQRRRHKILTWSFLPFQKIYCLWYLKEKKTFRKKKSNRKQSERRKDPPSTTE